MPKFAEFKVTAQFSGPGNTKLSSLSWEHDNDSTASYCSGVLNMNYAYAILEKVWWRRKYNINMFKKSKPQWKEMYFVTDHL